MPPGPANSCWWKTANQVTRQLQYVLEVEAVDYARLEVSSPGLDRPLKKPADWRAVRGDEVEVTLREAFQNRKKWRGVLAAGDGDNAWRLVLPEDKPLSRTSPRSWPRPAVFKEPARRRSRRWISIWMKCVRLASCRWSTSRAAKPAGRRRRAGVASDHARRMADKVDGGQD
jgi:hypothetical protein